MRTRLTERIAGQVAATLDELATEWASIEWDVWIALEPHEDEETGAIQVIPMVRMYISADQTDKLAIHSWIGMRVSEATDSNVDAMIRRAWESITIEELELRFVD
jgi:hypothetical protein